MHLAAWIADVIQGFGSLGETDFFLRGAWVFKETWMQEMQLVKICYATRTPVLHATPYTEPTRHWESLYDMLYIKLREMIVPLGCSVLTELLN